MDPRRVEQVAMMVSGERVSITVSVGTATVHKGEIQQAAEIIDRADRALYEAKAAGRNCVRSAAVLTQLPAPTPLVLGPGLPRTH